MKIVISEFMNAAAVDRLRTQFEVVFDPTLVDRPAELRQHLAEADALNLPFSDGSFEAVTIAFGLRNFSDRSSALKEIARVIKPGGVFGLLEFSPPPMPWKLFWNLYLHHLMPLVAQIVAKQGDSFRYLAQSIAEFPAPSALNHELSSAGLKLLFARSFALRLVQLTVCVRS